MDRRSQISHVLGEYVVKFIQIVFAGIELKPIFHCLADSIPDGSGRLVVPNIIRSLGQVQHHLEVS